ncbi:membrane protein, partial [Pontibacter sp. HJ8]
MEKIGLKYGIFTALSLIAYFLLMKLIGLERIIELRFLNGVIMAIGVTLAIR